MSLEQAAKAGAKAKIVMADGSPVKYKYITEINGNFYGVNKKSGVWIKTPVKTSPNTQVFLKDESASRWFTWGLIMAPPLALGLFVASVCILIGPCN